MEVEEFTALVARVGARFGTFDPEKPDDHTPTIKAALRHCDTCEGVEHV
jgi:hypothetical protein